MFVLPASWQSLRLVLPQKLIWTQCAHFSITCFYTCDVSYWSMSPLCLSGRTGSQPSCVRKTWTSGITRKRFNQIYSYLPCLEAPLTSAILYCFHWPWPFLGVTLSAQSKTYWLLFLARFSSDQDEIWCDEAVQAEHPETTFEKGFLKQWKQLLFYRLHLKKNNNNLMFACIWMFENRFDSNLVWW